MMIVVRRLIPVYWIQPKMVETFYWTKFRKNVIKNQNCKECQQDGGTLCEEGILRVGGNVQNTYGREKEEPSSGVS